MTYFLHNPEHYESHMWYASYKIIKSLGQSNFELYIYKITTLQSVEHWMLFLKNELLISNILRYFTNHRCPKTIKFFISQYASWIIKGYYLLFIFWEQQGGGDYTNVVSMKLHISILARLWMSFGTLSNHNLSLEKKCCEWANLWATKLPSLLTWAKEIN